MSAKYNHILMVSPGCIDSQLYPFGNIENITWFDVAKVISVPIMSPLVPACQTPGIPTTTDVGMVFIKFFPLITQLFNELVI